MSPGQRLPAGVRVFRRVSGRSGLPDLVLPEREELAHPLQVIPGPVRVRLRVRVQRDDLGQHRLLHQPAVLGHPPRRRRVRQPAQVRRPAARDQTRLSWSFQRRRGSLRIRDASASDRLPATAPRRPPGSNRPPRVRRRARHRTTAAPRPAGGRVGRVCGHQPHQHQAPPPTRSGQARTPWFAGGQTHRPESGSQRTGDGSTATRTESAKSTTAATKSANEAGTRSPSPLRRRQPTQPCWPSADTPEGPRSTVPASPDGRRTLRAGSFAGPCLRSNGGRSAR